MSKPETAAAPASADTTHKPTRLIYAYRFVNWGAKEPSMRFYEQLPGGSFDKDASRTYSEFTRKDLAGLKPGAVYEFKLDAQGNVKYSRGMAPIDAYTGPELAEWQMLERATVRQLEAAARIEKELSRNLMYEALEPIRATYNRMGAPQRAQIIADIVAYLHKGQR